MKKHYLFLLITLLFTRYAFAQIGYSPVVDSLVNLITEETVSDWNKQLTGVVPVMINGEQETIVTRHSYQPMNALAGQWILEQFQSFGLTTEIQTFGSSGENIIATITGTKYPDQYYIICGHYDDMPSGPLAPGADDNASGTVAVIEAARVLSNMELDYTLKFIAFDEEEQGLIGSFAYANQAAANGDDILGVLNLDMIAWDSDDDYEMSISVNSQSEPFANYFISGASIYAPELSHNFISTTASDHAPFWYNGYQAILVIEDWNDFNAFYHTTNDHFDILNIPYFHKMTQAAVGTISSLALGMYMELEHDPILSNSNTEDRIATVVAKTSRPLGTGPNEPRLYYKLNGGSFTYVNPFYYNEDTLKFVIPGQEIGTEVSYYIAVQDSTGDLVSTLPYGGQGINPPGTTPPEELYSYIVGDLMEEILCTSTVPKNIPDLVNTYDTIEVSIDGYIADVNVEISISHNNVGDLELFLISPNGAEVVLSTGNGGSGSNYINTVFDDEAETSITNGNPPFSGNFRPEESLSLLNGTYMAGDWMLRVYDNQSGTEGVLVEYCIDFTYYQMPTGMEDIAPYASELFQNYPNPFQDYTFVKFELSKTEYISLQIFDFLGREVIKIKEGRLSQGRHVFKIDGASLPAGRYFYRLQTDNDVIVKSMIKTNL